MGKSRRFSSKAFGAHLTLLTLILLFNNCSGGFDSTTGTIGGLGESASTGEQSQGDNDAAETDGSETATGTDQSNASAKPAPTIDSLTQEGDVLVVKWSDSESPVEGYGLVVNGQNTGAEHRTTSRQIQVEGLKEGQHCIQVYSRFPEIQQWPRSTEVCISMVGEAKPPSETGTTFSEGIKWKPGHYLRLVADGKFRANAVQFLENPYTTGLTINVHWKDLEPSRDVYDFSAIEFYLEKLKPYGKNLIIKLEERCFGGCTDAFSPKYLQSPEFNGGIAYAYRSNGELKGSYVRLWDRTVINRLLLLYKALGEKYDRNPYVAAIVLGNGESSISAGRTNEPGYTPQAYEDSLVYWATEVRKLLPHTITLTGLNYINGGVERMLSIASRLNQGPEGSGLIHPDTLPNQPSLMDLYDLEKSFSPAMPVVAQFQTAGITNDTSEEDMYLFARDYIGAQFYSWNAWFTSNWTEAKRPDYVNSYVLPVVNKYQGKANTRCPASIKKCI